MLQVLESECEDVNRNENMISFVDRMKSFFFNCLVIFVTYIFLNNIYSGLVVKLQISLFTLLFVITIGSILITMTLYIYHVYILDYFEKKNK